jgi:rhamnogalacturonyl hydrolase YesR
VLAVFALLAASSPPSGAVSPNPPSPTAAPPAELPPDIVEAIDAVLACERDGGGWMYVCEQGVRVWGATSIVNAAERVAEAFGVADWDVVVLRSPGTSTAGEILLDAYRRSARPDLLAAAGRAADLVVNLQLPNGGWFSEMPAYGDQPAPWFVAIAPWATLDDDVTSGSVRFLLALWQETGDARYRDAAERGLGLLVAAQLDDGAWPLTWRPRIRRWLAPSFEDLPSLNDAATSAVIETLVYAARVLDRPALLEPARRGADWLVAVRKGRPGWTQQYSMDGEPVPGRRFEPIALATWETRHALEALDAVASATGDQRYCEPFAAALDWFARAELRPRCWARFYSLEGERPIFLDRGGNPVSDVHRAKRPYRWTGDFGIPYLRLRLAAAAADGSPSGEDAESFRVAGDSGFCPGEYRYDFPRLDSPNPRIRLGMLATRLAALSAPVPLFCSALRPEPSRQRPAAEDQSDGAVKQKYGPQPVPVGDRAAERPGDRHHRVAHDGVDGEHRRAALALDAVIDRVVDERPLEAARERHADEGQGDPGAIDAGEGGAAENTASRRRA